MQSADTLHTLHTSLARHIGEKIEQLKDSAWAGTLELQKRSPADASEFKRGNKPNALPMQREE